MKKVGLIIVIFLLILSTTIIKNSTKEIEDEIRAGKKFYQMAENDDIAWFSLIGSNKALDVFDDCVSKGGNY